MKKSLVKEISLVAIVCLPFLYLAFIWADLPDRVPVHWNMEGVIDRYGSKSELLIVPFILPLLTYLIFLVAPKIDPKKKLEKMGNKLQNLKFIMTVFMSILAIYILQSAKSASLSSPNNVILLIGALYMILGNYFKTIQPNFFIGIRTPWTLQNETVWKETHKMAGKFWFIGGLIVVINSFTLNEKTNLILFLSVTAVITIIPIVFSYRQFKTLERD